MHEPGSTTWNFFVLLVVIAVAPFIAERLRLPSLLGLLLGGFLIGAHGLGVLTDDGVVEAVGSIGLLYLMFMAGLDLDLAVFARYRRAAIEFGGLTFVLPFVLGAIAATWLGMDPPAAILMGSVWASHTLVTYPIVRRFGLAGDPAVASSVGATVITDTLSLLVLALVAGSVTGDASGMALLVRLGLGLVGLLVLCFVILVALTRLFFRQLGHERTYRFIFILACCIGAATFADAVGIEGIVGAFFAGLALNRLVPNGSPLMERTEFFGSALFIPAFLVSVGLVIDLAVMTQLQTIMMAALFSVALITGKGTAAVLAGRRFGFDRAQVGTMFSLTLPQAAATLAATTVGAEIGLFGPTVVNAVVIVIVVSLTIASIVTTRFAARVAAPAEATDRLGAVVMIGAEEVESARRAIPLAKRLADVDSGLVLPVHVVAESDGPDGLRAGRATAMEIDHEMERAGLESPPSLRVAGSLRQGLRNAAAEARATLLVLEREADTGPETLILGGRYDELAAGSAVPVVVVALAAEPVRRVLLPLTGRDLAPVNWTETRIAVGLASRFAASGLEVLVGLPPDRPVPTESALPEEVRTERLPGSRVEWTRSRAAPGDLILLPGRADGPVFGLDASRLVRVAGVSVAVVVGPFRREPGRLGPDLGGTIMRADNTMEGHRS